MGATLTLVFEYVGDNLFNTYLEELPLIRVDCKPISHGRIAVMALLTPDMGLVREIRLVVPENLQEDFKKVSSQILPLDKKG